MHVFWRYLLKGSLLFVLYFVTAKFGLSLGAIAGFATAVWAPAGIAVALLFIWGNKFSPAIFLAAFLVNYSSGAPLIAALAIGVGNALEAIVGVYLLKRFGFHTQLDRVRDVFYLLLLSGVCSALISASIGVTSLFYTGIVTSASFLPALHQWWLGDMMGIIIVAPFIFVFFADFSSLKFQYDKYEAIFLASIVIVTTVLIFFISDIEIIRYLRPFFIVIILIWAAIRFEQQGAILSIVLVSTIVILATIRGYGPFHLQIESKSLLLVQSFLGILSFSILTLAAAVSERRIAYESMKKVNDELEDRVAKRTTQLLHEVEEHKAAKEKLHSSEEKFRAVSETAHESIITANSEGNMIYFSKGAEEMFGYKQEEVLNQPIEMIMPERYREPHRKGMKRYLASGKGIFMGRTIELTGLRKNNKEFAIEFSLAHWKSSEGQFFTAIIRDISDRISAMEEKERLFNLSLDMICTFGFDGYLKEVNPAYSRVLGYTKKELLEMPFWDFIHPEDRGRVKEVLKNMSRGLDLTSFVFRVITKEGKIRWWLSSATPFLSQNIAYAFNKDITDYKLSQENAAKSRHSLNIALEAAKMGTWEINFLDGSSERSYRYNQIFGYDKEPPSWNLDTFLEHVVEEDRGRVRKQLEESSIRGHFKIECRIVRNDDKSIRWILKSGRVIKDEVSKMPLKITGVVSDITEQKVAEEQVVKTSNALQEPFQIVTDFIQKHDKEGDDFTARAVLASDKMKQLIADLLKWYPKI